MRTKHERRGAVAVEMALCAPLVAFALVALADLSLVGLTASNVQTATQSASILCSQNKDNATAGAIRTTLDIPQDWTIKVDTNATNKKDANGQTIYTATITISAPYSWMTPGIASLLSDSESTLPDTITRRAITPIINPAP